MFGLLARRMGLDALRKGLKDDMRSKVDPLRADVKHLTHQLEQLTKQVERMTKRLEKLEEAREQEKRAAQPAVRQVLSKAEIQQLLSTLDEKQRNRVAQLPALLDSPRIVAHVRRAVQDATLHLDPYPHVVVENLVPDDVYAVMLEAIPPPPLFSQRDPIKQNLRVPMDFGPLLAQRVWQFVDEVVLRQGVQPALVEKMKDPLVRHYDTIFGPAFRERAMGMPLEFTGGRLMLRRPGYHLGPHRDPKRSIATCLLYFARPNDREDFGTEIYRVFDDAEASYTQTYYPDQEGSRSELVKVVPYRPNSMLAFLNSHGAHGANIPRDAPAELERYSCQFYLGPEGSALRALIEDLPPERQALWQGKKEAVAEY
jgi:hypothetical protein